MASTWNPEWLPLPGKAVFDHQHQQIAAVSRTTVNLDLFVIGNDNHVWTNFWAGNKWNGDWFPLPGQAVFDRVNQRIAAVSPDTQQSRSLRHWQRQPRLDHILERQLELRLVPASGQNGLRSPVSGDCGTFTRSERSRIVRVRQRRSCLADLLEIPSGRIIEPDGVAGAFGPLRYD